MAIPATLVTRPVTFDQLIALSDEIAALSRAGVPLGRGLLELGHDLPGRLGALATDIGKRLEAGENLNDILARSHFPPAYRAVIEAGLRVGRLPAALEDVSRSARRINQLRMSIGAALVYPLIVVALVWGLFWFTIAKTGPVLVQMLEDVGFKLPAARWTLTMFAETALWWQIVVPVLLGLWILTIWHRSGLIARGSQLHPMLAWGALGTLRKMHRAGRMGALTDLLAMLVSHDVPLDEAVELATAGVGTPEIEQGGQEIARRIRAGEISSEAPAGFPPTLVWTLTSGASRDQLTSALRRSAQVYRDDMQRRAQWLNLYIPVITTVIVGGLAVVLYAAISLGPWIVIMHQLSKSPV